MDKRRSHPPGGRRKTKTTRRSGGRTLDDCREAPTIASRADSDGRHGVAGYALDADNARRLREVSERRLAALAS